MCCWKYPDQFSDRKDFPGNLNQLLQINNQITHIGTATRTTGEVIHRQESFEYVNYYNVKILMAT